MRRLRIPVHPFLFALFPLVSLYATNAHLLALRNLTVPVACTLVLTALLLAGTVLMFGDGRRAAVVTSIVVLSVFFYSSFIAILPLVHLPSVTICVGMWAAVVLTAVLLVSRVRGDLRKLTTVLNVVALVAVAIPLIGLVPDAHSASMALPDPAPARPVRTAEPGSPDIYYIILDAYGRHDVLSKYFAFDNGPFLSELRRRGFYVATDSHSNYEQTYLSVASSLNQTYLDELAARIGDAGDDRRPLAEMIAGNRTASMLRARGYTFVSFATGYVGTEIPDADVYVPAPLSTNEFQYLLIGSTPFAALSEMLLGSDVRYVAHRNRILHTLDELGRPVTTRRPLFVFAHVLAPHPPFVFGPDGELTTFGEPFTLRDGIEPLPGGRSEYRPRYRDQLAFINGKVLQAVDRILSNSPTAIIIVQGDHGPGSGWNEHDLAQIDHWERTAILNAYYFPDRNYTRLYSTITPVNTFRLVFGQYFGDESALLSDHSYGSSYDHPYAFTDIDDLRNGPAIAN